MCKLLKIVGLSLIILLFLIAFSVILEKSKTVLHHRKNQVQHYETIPNTVHFIFIPSKDNDELTLHDFIALYSAFYYLKSPKIYLHTTRPLQEHSLFAAAVLNIPTLSVNIVDPITTTLDGKQIEKLAHLSDFLRVKILYEFGGVYCDLDAVILKDVEPLRKLGFRTILGRQIDGMIATGLMMAVPGSELIRTFRDKMHRSFKPDSWSGHSVGLLTEIGAELATEDWELLVLPQNAFFPVDWSANGIKLLFDDEATTMDWNLSFALHGFRTGIQWGGNWDAYAALSAEKLLQRKSNYARAVYPALKSAVDNNIIQLGL